MIDDTVRAYVVGATSEGYGEDWDLDQLWTSLKQLYPVGVTVDELEEEAGGKSGIDLDFLSVRLIEDAHAAYERREEELGADTLRELERRVLLEVIDRKWREHLYEMDYLKDGVGLRAYAQRDPLVEYQREGFDMFNQMLEGVKEEAVGFLFNLEVQIEEAPQISGVGTAPVRLAGKGLSPAAQRRQQQLLYSAPVIDGEAGSGGGIVLQESAPALGIGNAPPNGNGRTTQNGASAMGGKPSAVGKAGSAAGIVGSAAGGSSPGAQAANKRPSPGQAVGTGPSRNAPCPCGSGKKYKRCHGAPTT
jgi:preprotein translocase subunit SecA